MIAPVGHVYQAGTLSGNPVAMAAGLTQLKILKNHPEIYTHMSQMGEKLYEGMKELVKNTENHGKSTISDLWDVSISPIRMWKIMKTQKLLTQRSLHVTSTICWNMVSIWDRPSSRQCSYPMPIPKRQPKRHWESLRDS